MLINADALDTRKPQELVEGMFPRIGAGFAYGPPYWAKSLLFDGELALAVGNGTDFLGRKVIHGSVAVVLGEGLLDAGLRLKGRQIRQQQDDAKHAAALAEIEDDPAAAAEFMDDRAPYTSDRVFIETESFALPAINGQVSPSMADAMDRLSQIPDLELVILDSFADFLYGASPTHESSATKIMDGMHLLSAGLQCLVLAISHPTAKGDKMLGSGRLKAAADFVYRIEPVRGTPGGSGPLIAALSCEKNKYGQPPPPMQYLIESTEWLEPARDEAGELIEDAEPELVSTGTVRLYEPAKQAAPLRMPALELSGRPDSPAQLRVAARQPLAPPKRTGVLASARPAVTTFALKGI